MEYAAESETAAPEAGNQSAEARRRSWREPAIHQHYENHKIEPDITTLMQIADYFDTSIDYVVGHTEITRRIEPTSAYHLNADEGGIIDKYRALTPRERACVAQVIDTLLEK